MREQGTTDEVTQAAATRTRKKPQEVYIVEYAMSDTAQETVSAKLGRLMLAEAERLISERVS